MSLEQSHEVETRYSITPSDKMKVTTGVVIALILGTIAITVVPMALYTPSFWAWVFNIVFTGGMLLLIWVVWAFSPQEYVVSGKGIVVGRPVKSFLIPIEAISDVRPFEIDLAKVWKKMGNAGLFSYTGSFYTKQDGTFWMYTKNRNLVWVEADKPFVLSPDDREGFISQVRGYLKNKDA